MICPTELELDRAFAAGPGTLLARHLDECARCRDHWEQTSVVIELARALPGAALPAPAHRDELRTAILAGMPEPAAPEPPADAAVAPSRPTHARWVIPVLAIGALAASAAIVGQLDRESAEAVPVEHARRGAIHPHDGARFTQASQPPDEIVRLRDGVIDIDVDPLQPGERFRVVVGADEVEVHGTSFQVAAANDRISSVAVVHGRVSVKRQNAAAVVLGAGETWHIPVALTPPEPAPPRQLQPAPVPPAVVVPKPVPKLDPAAPAKLPDPQEVAFDAGWDAMRRNDLGAASAAFARAIALAPDGPLAEDAAFWRAVALAKLDRSAEAIAAFHAFLDAYPGSTRAGEASAMLGWMLVERGELDEARRRFRAAEHDPHPNAQQSARRGLEALDNVR